jgi:prepilin-type N-terminal cleavage/methylation domain-containing protein
MLNINKKLSKKGFSLIELMVAIAILAMAIFGIFHAYSVGFMGMADARDRTVASNYMREAMENVKNTDFDKIKQTYKSVTNANKEYKIYVTFSTETDNLKEIFTIVEWKDRNGIKKTVKSSMLVHFIEVFALDPAKIVLFADPYIILSNSTTNLTAAIKDIKGNTIIDWTAGNISFSIISGNEEDGSLCNTSDTTNGIATTTFTHDGIVGTGEINTYEIEASVYLPDTDITVTDRVTIKVTDGPVKITLTADPSTIKSNSIECSTITVSLQNAAGGTLKKNNLVSDIDITFSVFGDFVEGDLSFSTITIHADSSEEDAIATTSLCPTSKRGLATILARSTGLESGRTDVKFLGPPVSILISANPNSIYEDDPEGSTLTVSLIDKNGFYTNPDSGTITIYLELSTNPDDPSAYLETYSINFDSTTDPIGVNKTTKFKGQSSIGTAIITASGGGLIEDSVTISIRGELVPDNIRLTANTQNVQAGGTSTITATVYDGSTIAIHYIGTITFKTTLGTFSNGSNTIDVEVGIGKAITVLTSDSPGNAIIKITYPAPTELPFTPLGGLVVGFYGGADHVKLTASRQNVATGDISTIIATVCDSNGIHVSDYEGEITFVNAGVGFFYGASSINTINGIATIELSSENEGSATVTASSSDGSDVLYCMPSGGIDILFYAETTIILDLEITPTYSPEDLKVTFGIIAIGEAILVEGMNISWAIEDDRLKTIVIGSDEVYSGNSVSDAILDIDDTNLSDGVTYLVELTFGKPVTATTFMVTFYTPTIYTGQITLTVDTS